jgi:DNA-binding beta-propeller fold protein YncE
VVMAKALAKTPGDRYRSCLEFAAALRNACRAEHSDAGPAAAGPATPVRSATQAVSREDLAAAAAHAQASEPPARQEPVGEPPAVEPPAGQEPAAGVATPQLPVSQPPAGDAAPPSVPPAAGSAAEVPTTQLPVSQPPAGQAAPPSTPPGPASAPGEPAHEDTELVGAVAATPGGYRLPPRGPTARSRRSRGAVIAACVALLVLVGGGYALFGRGSGAGAGATLAVPGCTTKTAVADTVRKAHRHLVTTGLKPFDAVVTSHGYGFVTLTSALAVMRTTGPAPALVRTIPLTQALGIALTHDQRYLLVSGQSGLQVFSVSELEQGLSSPVGTLASPGGSHAVQVAVSPDDHYAFVTLQFSGQVAVFDLRRALKAGFGPADLVGLIRVPAQPVGITVSPDGHYIYVASGLATPASASGRGSLTVLDMPKAEKSPATSVVKVVNAGCGPDRVVVSNDGQDVWVTVGGGNALVAFSGAKLLTDPQHALIARVALGELPLGLAIYDHGTRIIVADSDRDHVPDGVSNLAVIDVQKALDHQPALLGTVRSGDVPRQVVPYPGGKTLLVTDTGSGQVQTIKAADLP